MYIFERDQGGVNNWGLIKKITANNGTANDQLGAFVSMSGETLAVGALYGGRNGSGVAYIFERNQGGPENWGEITTFSPSDGANRDEFGGGLLLEDDRLLVRAKFGDGMATNTGAAYLFERDNGGSNNWGEVNKFIASDGQQGDEFGGQNGGRLGMSDDVIAIGATFHHENGAVYLYYDLGFPSAVINKTVIPSVAEPGQLITYALQFENTGSFPNQWCNYD